jgi:transposase
MMSRSKHTHRRSSGQLSTVHPDAAGIDIGATFHVVAVPCDRDERPVRTFRTFSGDLHQLADWLTAVGITTIAMESTGVYWIPAFEILEARGFEVLLVNARDVKHVPGRKTDVSDAQWLQQLHQHGLLRGSFRPRDGLVRLRAYLRHRERLVEYAASHIQHMQKALLQMNVQCTMLLQISRGRPACGSSGRLSRGTTRSKDTARRRPSRGRNEDVSRLPCGQEDDVGA